MNRTDFLILFISFLEIYKFRHIRCIEIAIVLGVIDHHVATYCIDKQSVIQVAHTNRLIGAYLLYECICEAVAHPYFHVAVEHIGL